MNQIVPLGDQAVLIYFDRESSALTFSSTMRERKPAWLIDVVQAYASVAVFFRPEMIHYREAADQISEVLSAAKDKQTAATGPLHVIPCCYEFELDLRRITEHTNLELEKVIELHVSTEYTVYAIGFCPGFPYLGYLPPQLCGVPRLPSPRVRVEEGSVGLTGRQTGIYTLVRPGGWNILGKTPLQLVDVEDEYFPLRTGDRVRFRRIDETEYRKLAGERL